jgi:predicted ATPase
MEKGGKSIEDTLKEFLKEKRVLLLLDNFEQVIAAAPLAGELLGECPQVKMLVTSRAPLRIGGEHEFPVPPLALPNSEQLPSLDVLLSYPAVTLFVQRAQAVRPDFVVNQGNARAVAEVCIRADGLPLALELAAVWIRIMSPQVMLKRMEKRLRLLTGGARDLPARQRTLRNTIAWSYDLLDPVAKNIFRRSAIFKGGFSLDAAEAVCISSSDVGIDIPDSLTKLTEASLLRCVGVGDVTRFEMLETIREFALEALGASAEMRPLKERFVDFYLKFAERSERELKGPEQADWLTRLELEYENLQTALRLCLEDDEIERSLRFCSLLWRFWSIRGHLTEGRMLLRKTLDNPNSANHPMRAKVLLAAGALADMQDDPIAGSLLHESLLLSQKVADEETTAFAMNSLGNVVRDHGDFVEAKRLHSESLAIFQKLENKWGIALVLNNLGVNARSQGDFQEAVKFHEQSLQLFRELGDKRHIARCLINLGIIFERKRDYEAAHELLDESLGLSRELGEKTGTTESLLFLGSVSRLQNDYAASRKLLAESLALSLDIGNKEGIIGCLEEFARLACMKGEAGRAARLLGTAEALREAIHVPVPPAYRAEYERDISLTRSTLGEETFKDEWTQGRAMRLEQAIAYALVTESEKR